MLNKQPLVSIIVTNYNYERFLRESIDSALAQTYPRVEVIVVDDGSTDGSRRIIAEYGSRIIPIYQANAGQASAFNVGFASCAGELVMFLDSDDLLSPETVEHVARVFNADPGAGTVIYRLGVITDRGARTGEIIPSLATPLPTGDLRRHTLQFPDDIVWPPTTGNAYAARVLAKILPMPVISGDESSGDFYLHNLTPLFGSVHCLAIVGGFYRVHAANKHYESDVDLDQIRKVIQVSTRNHAHIVRFSGEVSIGEAPWRIYSVTLLAHRLISLRLDARNHPVVGDRAWKLAARGGEAAWRRFDVGVPMKIVYSLWFICALVAPKSVLLWLARRFFHPHSRGWVGNALLRVRRL